MLKSLNHERVMKCVSCWFDSNSNTLNMIIELFPSGSLKKYLSKYDNGADVDSASIKNWATQILEVVGSKSNLEISGWRFVLQK
ncbi:hypothetical protein HAX54_034555, partial [Datura stramonium]|nr:hypothetical protein [Datura stramonium]